MFETVKGRALRGLKVDTTQTKRKDMEIQDQLALKQYRIYADGMSNKDEYIVARTIMAMVHYREMEKKRDGSNDTVADGEAADSGERETPRE